MVGDRKSFSEYIKLLVNDWKLQIQETKKGGGWSLFVRSMTVHALWVFAIFQIITLLLPIKDSISEFAIAGILLMTLTFLGNTFKNRLCPKSTLDLLEGRFAYSLRRKDLNYFILGLLMFNSILAVAPIKKNLWITK